MSHSQPPPQPDAPGARHAGHVLRRSAGRRVVARAPSVVRPHAIELKVLTLAPLQPGQARVRTLFSCLNCGMRRLILGGPAETVDHAKATFPAPLEAAAVGVVEDGPDGWSGRLVYAPHPVQDVFHVAADDLVAVPDGVNARRATLAGSMAAALNALWEAGAGPGDRIAVIGADATGLLAGMLAARIPGTTVWLADERAERGRAAKVLGLDLAAPFELPREQADCVILAPGGSAWPEAAIRAAGVEATLVACAMPAGPTRIDLDGAFMRRRLKLVASDPAIVSASRRARWNQRRLMETALALLTKPVFDDLITNEIAFDRVPKDLPDRLAASGCDLPPIIRYET